MDSAQDLFPELTETSQQSVNQSSAVCLLQTETSQPHYFGNNQPGPNPNIRLHDFEQIAQSCGLNFRETMIGEAPIADLVCQGPNGELASMAQYQQEPCHHKHNQ